MAVSRRPRHRRQHGGGGDLDNLCWSCSRCNLHKGTNLSSVESHLDEPVPLFQPRQDRWEAHFRLEAGRILGLSPKGRVTVRLLAMNSSNRVELRERLRELGEL
jgi:hypothetical protein